MGRNQSFVVAFATMRHCISCFSFSFCASQLSSHYVMRQPLPPLGQVGGRRGFEERAVLVFAAWVHQLAAPVQVQVQVGLQVARVSEERSAQESAVVRQMFLFLEGAPSFLRWRWEFLAFVVVVVVVASPASAVASEQGERYISVGKCFLQSKEVTANCLAQVG